MNDPNPSLYFRALAAFVLFLGFYALALGLIGGLVWLTWFQFFVMDRFHPYLVFFSATIVFFLVAAIIPRRDPFVAPGLLLTPDAHPELFKEIATIAQATSQPMPQDVYLIHEANAWVAVRGHLSRSRPILALGYPLLLALTQNELRAVLAHEFGHYTAGDTRLAPWIHHTRQVLGRTMDSLSGNALDFLFLGYAKLFLRVTNAISRQQELDADRLAARLIGGESLVSGLKKIATLAPGHEHFWHTEVVPLLDSGFLPPIGAGFSAYCGNPFIQKIVKEALSDELRIEDADAYDTHPPLAERIRNVHAFVSSGPRNRPEPAAAWLGEAPDLERRLLDATFPEADVHTLSDLAWSEALERVYLPGYARTAREHTDDVAGLRLSDLPSWVVDPFPVLEKLDEYVDPDLSRPDLLNQLSAMFGPLITAILAARGAEVVCEPGEPVYVVAPFGKLRAFWILGDLLTGELKEEQWRALCDTYGVGDADLGELCGALPAPAESVEEA
jgi:Zn-dependent protease with chaperone function